MKKIVIRISTIVMLALVIASGSALFWVSQKVQQLERQQRYVRQQVESEKEGIRVLSAEWDYLNRPDRLELLANRYLKTMEPVEPEDLLKNANLVPEKPEEIIVPVAYPVAKPTPPKQSIARYTAPEKPIKETKKETTPSFDDILNNVSEGAR